MVFVSFHSGIDFYYDPKHIKYTVHQVHRTRELKGVQYVSSKRGTQLVLFNGNTYTPNEKPGTSGVRNWKCSMYYKMKCKARVITRRLNGKEYLRPAYEFHTHYKQYGPTSNDEKFV